MELKGKTAVTESDLNPRGIVQIDNEIYQACSESGLIEQGRGVKVIRVKGGKIFVVRV